MLYCVAFYHLLLPLYHLCQLLAPYSLVAFFSPIYTTSSLGRQYKSAFVLVTLSAVKKLTGLAAIPALSKNSSSGSSASSEKITLSEKPVSSEKFVSSEIAISSIALALMAHYYCLAVRIDQLTKGRTFSLSTFLSCIYSYKFPSCNTDVSYLAIISSRLSPITPLTN